MVIFEESKYERPVFVGIVAEYDRDFPLHRPLEEDDDGVNGVWEGRIVEQNVGGVWRDVR